MIIVENNKLSGNKDFKILNFYSDGCPPCHAFMPNFIAAEETFGDYFDFILINVANNMQLAGEFGVRGTPTIIILDGSKIIFNQSGVPNGQELKKIMVDLIGEQPKKKIIVEEGKETNKKFFGLF